ncbi:glycosyl hydrolase 2 galactose-binding domain-containing protein [Demequina sp. SO4-13]|uniref:glycosyl hydrolase 2 galactose-binding domain-containing protein n=1 Tax=Demequina sp. SO4-13 TaxID=3401027 RepID=UPI003AF96A62
MSAVTFVSNPIHEGWTLTHTGGDAPSDVERVSIPAHVPGSVPLDLDRAGLLPDGPREDGTAADWMNWCEWRYATQFAATPATPGERVDVVFDGLDTVATVKLNDMEIARTKNMHRSYRFDVRELVVGGANELTVDFVSALAYARGVDADARRGDVTRAYRGVRKMAWGFGPFGAKAAHTAGIWGGVRIERWRVARLDEVRPLVTLDGDSGRVQVHVRVERAAGEPLTVYASLAGAESSAQIPPGEVSGVVTVEAPNIEAWWPHGHGPARLYDLVVDLHSTDERLDTHARRIGFRSAVLTGAVNAADAGVEIPDTPQVSPRTERVSVTVNSQPLDLQVERWMPLDTVLSRIAAEDVRARIEQMRDAGAGVIHVDGVGVYESPLFYQTCDELGLFVVQDPPFVGDGYRAGAPVQGEAIEETREHVARLAPHPSLLTYGTVEDRAYGSLVSGIIAVLDHDRLTT